MTPIYKVVALLSLATGFAACTKSKPATNSIPDTTDVESSESDVESSEGDVEPNESNVAEPTPCEDMSECADGEVCLPNDDGDMVCIDGEAGSGYEEEEEMQM